MRIGIDLLWVRPGICGGTESFIRNLMNGFGRYDKENNYILFTTKDNADSFHEYDQYLNMERKTCPVCCANQGKRILWENLHLDSMAKETGVDVMFIPVYSKPHSFGRRIPYVSVIHDLQALHYPAYFSGIRRLFLKYTWRYACRTSDRIITISDYCKEDLIAHYPWVKNKIVTRYIPVISEASDVSFENLGNKYHIEAGQYYYCVSSLLPHKNLITILKVMADYKKKGRKLRLVISGVGGEEQAFGEALQELDIEDMVIQTGFVSNKERDCLYENCRLFLFPSIFEGFGMPPIEAMRKGKNVVMTQESCLKEITEGKAIYVNSPTDADEWMEKMAYAEKQPQHVEKFEKYDLENVTRGYVEVLTNAGL